MEGKRKEGRKRGGEGEVERGRKEGGRNRRKEGNLFKWYMDKSKNMKMAQRSSFPFSNTVPYRSRNHSFWIAGTNREYVAPSECSSPFPASNQWINRAESRGRNRIASLCIEISFCEHISSNRICVYHT